jgi:hypothetical protein
VSRLPYGQGHNGEFGRPSYQLVDVIEPIECSTCDGSRASSQRTLFGQLQSRYNRNVTVNSSQYADRPTNSVGNHYRRHSRHLSEYLNLRIYNWVTSKSNAGLAPPVLGRWLGVSHRVGRLMSYWVLPPSGIPTSCTTVQRLTNLETQTDKWSKQIRTFDDELASKFQATSSDISNSIPHIPHSKLLDLDGEDPAFIEAFSRVIDDDTLPHNDC